MTLNDILVSALAQLDRGHDAQTMDIFRERLTGFANEAQADLARAIGFRRTETLPTSNGIAELSELTRACIKIIKTEQCGREVRFKEGDMGTIGLPYLERVSVTYLCEPRLLRNPSDVSELPEYVHPLIVSYIVGRERMAGDVSTQRGANIYLSMYEAAKARLRPNLGEHESYELVNRY